MNRPLLEITGLAANAVGTRLLDDVTLGVNPGETLCVLGESGSGKTTLGLAAQGEHGTGVELSGSVRLRGLDLLSPRERRRRAARSRRIGYLPQHPAAVLNPARRIGSVLGELAPPSHRTRERRRDAVRRALESAHLPPDERLLRRFPHQLSGGQQQRVALAHALITEPELLILDEPTSGLDTVTRAETVDTLRELTGAGTGVLLLTHDLGLARELADGVTVLRGGEVVERGATGRVMREPAHEYTGALLAAEPRLPVSGHGIAEPDPSPSVGGLRADGLRSTSPTGVPLLHEAELAVPPGHRVAVVGRSGAGKTTLARCLAGLTPADSGRIELDGAVLDNDIHRRSRRQRGAVQYVHQDARASFDEFRTVGGQLARTVRLNRGGTRRSAREATARALRSVGLDEATHERRPAELSGGQLQRAALARALLAEPAVLICDEITAAQDVVNQSELLGLLREITERSAIGLVLISHDLAAVAPLADEVLVMAEGRCVERAPTGRLLGSPRSTVATRLVTAARR
ncbi:peptide/nickel transport system ATP-binding protein [Actinopolyspora alba]|uniref:Peptide/nickel transport system ATP-binding protein n=1 Tax=Actinopolyspora alba TaxID=673379 RepID=A0A1I1ULS0_9ACTN|nr:ATP-binding cassette domain-containing protein [Actinopolyspora alba]SFD71707.1 peptide/nickel transport system ATP-binding protein [Actinopolyspora alba]